MHLNKKTSLSLILALQSANSYLLRKSNTIIKDPEPTEDEGAKFEVSKYIYQKTKQYKSKRIFTYCNTDKPNCEGIQYYEHVMLQKWTKFWEEAGWDPIVLTIGEAQQHGEYNKYESIMGEKKFSVAQQHMFFRYLAVTSTGAEWFSESHTIPLDPLLGGEDILPNGGKFTVYDRHVPSLMSGSQQEWGRITHSLLQDPKATDLEGLNDIITKDPNAYQIEKSILHAKYIVGPEQFENTDICVTTNNKRALRLSINEFQGTGPSIDKWGDVTESFMKVWNGKCNSGGRPVMFTYFEPIKSVSTSRSMDLTEAWKKAWRKAGWEPVVLTMGDVLRHPRHRDIINAFENSEGKYKMSLYDRMCFYRWFAMAASGGGWMSDIDAFPLHMEPSKYAQGLPYNGVLTGYARHIPCLVSGSSTEWDRIGWILVDSYKIHADEFWSDMLALEEVHQILDVFQYKRDVVEFHQLFDKNEKLDDPYKMKTGNRDRCLLANDKKVVHFSHWSVRQGIEGVGFPDEDFDNQEKIAVTWTQSWREQCGVLNNQMNQDIVGQQDSSMHTAALAGDVPPVYGYVPQPMNNKVIAVNVKPQPPREDFVISTEVKPQVKKEVDPYGDKKEDFVIQKKEVDPYGDKEEDFVIQWRRR